MSKLIIIEGLETTKGAITEGQRLNNEDLFKLDTVLKVVNCCKYNSIQNENNNFIIWNDEKNYSTESINNNEFIIWDNEKRNHNDILNTLRNTVQMDIDDIDMIMRRKERMIEEDKALEELLYSDDDRYYNNTNKEEEEE